MKKITTSTTPCPKGHGNEIYSATGKCTQCIEMEAGSAPWEVLTRREAVSMGLNKFWNGKPCVNGHVAHRYTITNVCAACSTMHTTKYQQNIREVLGRAKSGLVSVTVDVHPDDKAALEATAEALRAGRGL
jgi:hypothetical protein